MNTLTRTSILISLGLSLSACNLIDSDPGLDPDCGDAACEEACEGCEPEQSRCGDGVVDADEVCDDGNTADGDGCSADCSAAMAMCGDGTLDDGEECDDGNDEGGDGCSADCSAEQPSAPSCGDGILQAGEECDPGRAESMFCSPACEDMIFDVFGSANLDGSEDIPAGARIRVGAHSTLTVTGEVAVGEGALFEMGAGAMLVIDGGMMRFEGTEDEPILVTQLSATPEMRSCGSWGGVQVVDPFGAGLAGVSMKHTRIEYSRRGIMLEGASARFEDVAITDVCARDSEREFGADGVDVSALEAHMGGLLDVSGMRIERVEGQPARIDAYALHSGRGGSAYGMRIFDTNVTRFEDVYVSQIKGADGARGLDARFEGEPAGQGGDGGEAIAVMAMSYGNAVEMRRVRVDRIQAGRGGAGGRGMDGARGDSSVPHGRVGSNGGYGGYGGFAGGVRLMTDREALVENVSVAMIHGGEAGAGGAGGHGGDGYVTDVDDGSMPGDGGAGGDGAAAGESGQAEGIFVESSLSTVRHATVYGILPAERAIDGATGRGGEPGRINSRYGQEGRDGHTFESSPFTFSACVTLASHDPFSASTLSSSVLAGSPNSSAFVGLGAGRVESRGNLLHGFGGALYLDVESVEDDVTRNPVFMDESSLDFTPASHSPLVDAAPEAEVTRDVLGRTRDARADIGAWEYVTKN